MKFKRIPLPAAAAALVLATLLATTGCSAVPAKPSVPPQVEMQQYLNSGRLAAQNGQHELALSEYVKALGLDPRNVEAHYLVALSQVALDKLQPASLSFRHVLSLAPDHVGALEGLGLLLLRQAQYPPARQLLERAVALDPASWRSLNALGTIADLQRNHAAAQDYYARALGLNPNSVVLINNLGYSRYLAGRLDEAQTQFERAIAIEPQYAQAWSNLGLVHARKGRTREAMRAFGQSMPESEAAYTTGYVCMLDNRLRDAESMFRRAIDLSPTYYAEAQEGLARVQVLRNDALTGSRQ